MQLSNHSGLSSECSCVKISNIRILGYSYRTDSLIVSFVVNLLEDKSKVSLTISKTCSQPCLADRF